MDHLVLGNISFLYNRCLSFTISTFFIVSPYHVRENSKLLQSKNASERELKREEKEKRKKEK